MARRAVRPNADLLTDLRQRANWTIEDLADAAGLSPRQVGEACRGNPVGTDFLNRLAQAFTKKGFATTLGDLMKNVATLSNTTVTIIFEANLADEEMRESASKFVKFLTTELPATGNLLIRQVSAADALISIEMNEEDVARLAELLPTIKAVARGVRGPAQVAPGGKVSEVRPQAGGGRTKAISPDKLQRLLAPLLRLTDAIKEVRISANFQRP